MPPGTLLEFPTMDYSAWRAQAAAELKCLHGIDADCIPERVWKQLYVQNSSPREAANRAQMHYTETKPAFERAREWLKQIRGGSHRRPRG